MKPEPKYIAFQPGHGFVMYDPEASGKPVHTLSFDSATEATASSWKLLLKDNFKLYQLIAARCYVAQLELELTQIDLLLDSTRVTSEPCDRLDQIKFLMRLAATRR